jgi:hypothetical protein
MPFVDISSLPVTERLPGWYGRYFHSSSMTFAHYDFVRGSSIHEHFHPQEEVYEVIDKRACIDWSGQLPDGRQPERYAVGTPGRGASAFNGISSRWAGRSRISLSYRLRWRRARGHLKLNFPTLWLLLFTNLSSSDRRCGSVC